jgi:hypothetical protein
MPSDPEVAVPVGSHAIGALVVFGLIRIDPHGIRVAVQQGGKRILSKNKVTSGIPGAVFNERSGIRLGICGSDGIKSYKIPLHEPLVIVFPPILIGYMYTGWSIGFPSWKVICSMVIHIKYRIVEPHKMQ